MDKDPYVVLGLSRSATDDEIRSAYRKLAKELHPDVNPGDVKAEERFKDVSSAFNVLGDPEKRARFDRGEIDASGQTRTDPFYREYARSGTYAGHGAGFDPNSGFADIFGDIFGARDFAERGADTRYKLTISFLEAAVGAKKRIVLPEGGTLNLNVPAGVADGQTLRLKGKGAQGPGYLQPGDALIEITVRPHHLFERDGDDIITEIPITVDEAVLGGKIEVPTIHGRVFLKIPEGSNSGQVLRLRRQGIKNARSGKTGDHHVRLKVMLPDKIDPEFREFLTEWREKNPYNPRIDL